MRRILLIFILPLLIITTIVFAGFGIVQVRFEEKKEMAELQRKARSVAESIELSARYILINHDMVGAARAVNLFSKGNDYRVVPFMMPMELF